jgi:mannose-6-phosphate isomerase-like protein (cupin superfamily)
MAELEKPGGVVGPGEGRIFTARGSVMAFKAVAAQTGGDFSLMERTLPPGGRRPPAHRHVNCSEGFYILDGQVLIERAGELLTAQPGDFVLVPRDVMHTFGNGGEDPARLLVLHTPAMDAYFAELDRLWSSEVPPAPEQEQDLQQRYGMLR